MNLSDFYFLNDEGKRGAAVHSKVHTKGYYRDINNLLRNATNKNEAEAILKNIGENLTAGKDIK